MLTDEPLLFDAPLSRSEIVQFLKEDDLRLWQNSIPLPTMCAPCAWATISTCAPSSTFQITAAATACTAACARAMPSFTRFRMSEEEIVSAAVKASEKGYRTVVLQSGEDPWYTEETICRIIDGIKEACDMAITLSVGEHPYKTLKAWFNEGADRYLLKHETCDPDLYEQLHPDLRFEDRIDTLRNPRKSGTRRARASWWAYRARAMNRWPKDILLFKELDIDMIGCGPYIHDPKTPLAT